MSQEPWSPSAVDRNNVGLEFREGGSPEPRDYSPIRTLGSERSMVLKRSSWLLFVGCNISLVLDPSPHPQQDVIFFDQPSKTFSSSIACLVRSKDQQFSVPLRNWITLYRSRYDVGSNFCFVHQKVDLRKQIDLEMKLSCTNKTRTTHHFAFRNQSFSKHLCWRRTNQE